MSRLAALGFVLRMCHAHAYCAATAVLGCVGREAHFYVSVLLKVLLCCACAMHVKCAATAVVGCIGREAHFYVSSC
jgi:hypothetical protein